MEFCSGVMLFPIGRHEGADASFLTADHLFVMAKQCQNGNTPVCGCTNHAENLSPAPSRRLFSPSVSLWRFSSKPFQAPYFPTVNCFTSPEPNYAFIPSASPVRFPHFTPVLPHSGALTNRWIWNVFSLIYRMHMEADWASKPGTELYRILYLWKLLKIKVADCFG